MRISGSGSYLNCAQEVVDELKVGGNEVESIDEIGKVVTVVLAILYNGEVGNKN